MEISIQNIYTFAAEISCFAVRSFKCSMQLVRSLVVADAISSSFLKPELNSCLARACKIIYMYQIRI